MTSDVLPALEPATWRLIVDEAPRSGAANMALDQAVAEACAAGESLPTLRFYRWEPPAVSLGRHQRIEEVDLEAWYVARFLGFWRAAEDDPESFYFRFRHGAMRWCAALPAAGPSFTSMSSPTRWLHPPRNLGCGAA